jgi:hypothetical protein
MSITGAFVTASSSTDPKTGNLGITVGTWLFLLHSYGHALTDPAIKAACEKIASADPASVDQAGMDLVKLVQETLEPSADAAAISAWLGTVIDSAHIGRIEGDDRAARTARIRSYQFQSSLPLLTSVLNRFPDGIVKSHWVMVERVTETVTCMDPYPWDDLDEEYTLPLVEFMVRWELAGCESIVFRA